MMPSKGGTRLADTTTARIGLWLVVFVVIVAVLGPIVAPHDPTDIVGPPGQAPSSRALLGTDQLGFDVLSRLLFGGRSVLFLGVTTTILSYAVAIPIGLAAGHSRGVLDTLLMRSVDVLLAFPALLIMILAVTAVGRGSIVLIGAVALVHVPSISRVVRTATLEVSVREYVDAAIARGERTVAILTREIVPNIAGLVMADIGLRFGYSVVLIASVNYLGLGLSPPTADWALMISENQQFITINQWSVIAPAVMLALLTVGVNLVGDAVVHRAGRAATPRAPSGTVTITVSGAADRAREADDVAPVTRRQG